MSSTAPQRLLAEVVRLYPRYAAQPLDVQWNHGNAAFLCIGADGEIVGRLFGADAETRQRVHQVATRKVLQVWRTGYHTGRFEQLVFAGKLDEGAFGLQRPDFIGWEGGVPLTDEKGGLIAAAFSGFRGSSDIEIIELAAQATGLAVLRREPGQ